MQCTVFLKFLAGRKASDQILTGDTNSFIIHYPQVSWQKSKDLAYFLLDISIEILFALKQLQKSNTSVFYLFNQLCLDYILNLLNDLKVCNKKCFFLLSH